MIGTWKWFWFSLEDEFPFFSGTLVVSGEPVVNLPGLGSLAEIWASRKSHQDVWHLDKKGGGAVFFWR